MITGFLALYILQNLWRPVLISRFDAHSSEARGATVLSIESQAKSAATMVFAPLMGAAVDFVKSRQIGVSEFWPVAVAQGGSASDWRSDWRSDWFSPQAARPKARLAMRHAVASRVCNGFS